MEAPSFPSLYCGRLSDSQFVLWGHAIVEENGLLRGIAKNNHILL